MGNYSRGIISVLKRILQNAGANTVRLSSLIVVSLLGAPDAGAQELKLWLEYARPASFVTSFTVKNNSPQEIRLFGIKINDDEFCDYRIWRRKRDEFCHFSLPGTGGGAQYGKNSIEMFPVRTTSKPEESALQIMAECHWEPITSYRLGTTKSDYKFRFNIYSDTDNSRRCSNYRRITLLTDHGEFNWEFDPEQNMIEN